MPDDTQNSEIDAIMTAIEAIADLAAGIQLPPNQALSLGRVKDLLDLAGQCVALIGSQTNDPQEARFVGMVVKAAIDHWQPSATNPPSTRR